MLLIHLRYCTRPGSVYLLERRYIALTYTCKFTVCERLAKLLSTPSETVWDPNLLEMKLLTLYRRELPYYQ
jgi:hypothetical protein